MAPAVLSLPHLCPSPGDTDLTLILVWVLWAAAVLPQFSLQFFASGEPTQVTNRYGARRSKQADPSPIGGDSLAEREAAPTKPRA